LSHIDCMIEKISHAMTQIGSHLFDVEPHPDNYSTKVCLDSRHFL